MDLMIWHGRIRRFTGARDRPEHRQLGSATHGSVLKHWKGRWRRPCRRPTQWWQHASGCGRARILRRRRILRGRRKWQTAGHPRNCRKSQVRPEALRWRQLQVLLRSHHPRRQHRQRQRCWQAEKRGGSGRHGYRRWVGHVSGRRQHCRLVRQALPLFVELVDLFGRVSSFDQPFLDLRRSQVEHHDQPAENREDEQAGKQAGDDKLPRFLDRARMAVDCSIHGQQTRQ
mmetsp:Transcript_26533/g.62107  ORF Transcript_26533/g.62107 Transcript_26533/m.62107 type:complete len:229 (+) Transcript_26533:951-1637(+)